MKIDRNRVYELHNQGMSGRAIAREIGCDDRSIQRMIHTFKNVGDNKPADVIVPTTAETAHNAAPDGFRVRGVSTLYDADGGVKQQWVKTWENDLWERVNAAARACAEKLEPLAPALYIGGPAEDRLLNLVTLTDSHVGMLAWSRETGEKWDLDIAEDLMSKLFVGMIESAPAAGTCIVNQLGDFLHFDSLVPLTPTNHNILDADSRYQKVVEVAVRILRRVVEAALKKHPVVQVYMHEGNHDPAGSVWLRVMMAQLYANEPRVTVGQSPLPYVSFEHGKTMLAFHHGHMAKNASLPLLFAARFAETWGRTTKRYIHTGHRHHVDEKEHPGVKVVQHPTIASADAFAARGGWLSERQATCMTYHAEFGEVGRMVWVPEMVGYESRRRDL